LVYDPRELSGLAELLEDPLQTRRLAAGLTAADQETKA
jgi:hypothetical protein